MKIILASGSPRRAELLASIKLNFDIIVSHELEDVVYTTPEEYVRSLAIKKAVGVAKQCGKDDIIIGADTIVCYKNKPFGKPRSRVQARQMLKMLSNTYHYVYTAICVVKGEKVLTNVEKTLVVFNKLSNKLIAKYVKTGKTFDKAGGYGIQDGYNLVKKYIGDYENVVGLSTTRLKQLLSEVEE